MDSAFENKGLSNQNESTSTISTPNNEPLPDSSYGWLVVLASFFMQASSFGVATSFGVFVNHYTKSTFKDTEYAYISLIGTVAPTTLALASMFTGRLCDLYGFRICTLAGAFLIALSYTCASFSTQVWHLILTQGFLFGVGGAMIYVPANSVVIQWFDKYRGLAVGIGTSGSGIGGMIFTLLNAHLLETVDYQWTLRYNAIICFCLLFISAIIVRPRIPSPKNSDNPNQQVNKMNWKHLIDIRFGLFIMAMLFASLGYLVPLYYIPTYTTDLGYQPQQGANLLAIINGMSAFGRIVLGLLGDKLGHLNIFISCLGLSTAFLIIWRFAENYTTLIIFSVLFGLPNGGFAGGFTTACAELFGTNNLSTILGLAYAPTGFGDLAGPSLAGLIFDQTRNYHYLIYYAIGMAGVSFIFLSIIKLFIHKPNSKSKV